MLFQTESTENCRNPNVAFMAANPWARGHPCAHVVNRGRNSKPTIKKAITVTCGQDVRAPRKSAYCGVRPYPFCTKPVQVVRCSSGQARRVDVFLHRLRTSEIE